MTGPLELEDLSGLDRMVSAFEAVAVDGPDKILRDVNSWWPGFKQFLVEKKNTTWVHLDSFHTFKVNPLFL